MRRSRGLERLLGLDGRVVAGAVVVAFFVAFTSVSYTTGSPPWPKVGVGAARTGFEDLESVTSSWDCERRGVQAFPDNPCDPLGRPANYPRLWTQLSWTGLGEGDTRPLGVAIGALFLLAALLVPGPLGLWEGAASLLAPASLLGIERGNVDLLMFAIVAAGVCAARRHRWLAASAFTAAGVLKLFPIVAIVTLLRNRAARWAAVGMVAFGTYALATLGDIRAIFRVIPREIADSYGSGVFADALREAHGNAIRNGAETRIAQIVLILAALGLSLALLALGSRRHGRPSPPSPARPRRIDAFWAGASIYLLTYAFGNNFDYRLVFLILCVPQLCSWSSGRASPVALPWAALAALVGTLWLSSSAPPLPFGLQSWYVGFRFPPEELLNWFLFAWLTAALLATLRSESDARDTRLA